MSVSRYGRAYVNTLSDAVRIGRATYNAARTGWNLGKRVREYTSRPNNPPKRRRTQRTISRGGGYYRKTLKVSAAKSLSGVASKVRNLEKRVKKGETTFDFRYRGSTVLQKNRNVKFTSSAIAFGWTAIDTICGALQYYDEATDTWSSRDVTGTATSKHINVKSGTTSFQVKNSHQVPVVCKIHICVPKVDTASNPTTDYEAGIPDIVVNPGTMLPTNALLKISDSKVFTKNWRIAKTFGKKKALMPGETFTCSYTVRDIDFDPSLSVLEYQKRLKSYVCMVELEQDAQCVGHTAGTGLIAGHISGQVDIVFDQRTIITYDGGMYANRVHVQNQAGDILAGGLTGLKPMSDNQVPSHT